MKLAAVPTEPAVVAAGWLPSRVEVSAIPRAGRDPEDGALIDVAVPVHNEERVLVSSIRRLRAYLDACFPFRSVVTIVDNASTDATTMLARRLAAELDGVRCIHLERKGRGRALRTAWSSSDAPVVAYMDVDLSTSLDALLPLVAPLLSGHSSLSIGTRLANGAAVERSLRRELISRGYNLLLKVLLRSRFSDAQCGFKAVASDIAQELLHDIADEEWFFDTELLVRAQMRGLRIHEVPVDWVEDRDSRVAVVRTAAGDLKGIARLLRERARGFCELGELQEMAP